MPVLSVSEDDDAYDRYERHGSRTGTLPQPQLLGAEAGGDRVSVDVPAPHDAAVHDPTLGPGRRQRTQDCHGRGGGGT